MTLTKSLSIAALVAAACDLNLSAADEARPFPQRTAYTSGTILPNQMLIGGATVSPTRSQLEAPVKDFYTTWRTKYLKTVGDVAFSATSEAYVSYNLDNDNPDLPTIATVAEAHGYGMLITALMAGRDGATTLDAVAKQDFDSLVRYFKNPAHKSSINPILMASRQIGADLHTEEGDADSATDGDLDIAYALLLADKQWGSVGSINYLQEAHTLLQAIMNSEVNQTLWSIKLGDWVSDAKPKQYIYGTRTSDFMVQHWNTFGNVVTGQAEKDKWNNLRSKTYDILAAVFVNNAPATGLMPDFMAYKPAPALMLFAPVTGKYLEDSKGDGAYYYNACRTPWRLATDYLINGDARALTQLSTLNLWIQRKTDTPEVSKKYFRGAPLGDPAKINAGYTLAGVPLYASRHDSGSCFTAPLAVSAMVSSANQEWLNLLWANLVASVQPPAPSEKYFNDTVKLLCMITITGNWWDPAAP